MKISHLLTVLTRFIMLSPPACTYLYGIYSPLLYGRIVDSKHARTGMTVRLELHGRQSGNDSPAAALIDRGDARINRPPSCSLCPDASVFESPADLEKRRMSKFF